MNATDTVSPAAALLAALKKARRQFTAAMRRQPKPKTS